MEERAGICWRPGGVGDGVLGMLACETWSDCMEAGGSEQFPSDCRGPVFLCPLTYRSCYHCEGSLIAILWMRKASCGEEGQLEVASKHRAQEDPAHPALLFPNPHL